MPRTGRICPLVSRLSWLYAAALGALALLAAGGQGVVQAHLRRQLDDSHLINVAGRQRMLSQKIAKAALTLTRNGSQVERTGRREELRVSLDRWDRAQRGLQFGDPAQNLPPAAPALLPRYQSLAPSYQTMRRAANRLLDHPSDTDALADLLDAEPVFLNGMNVIVNEYDRQASARVVTISHLEWSFLSLTLFVLLLEGFGVFLPITRLVQDSLKRQRDAADALRRQQQQMEETAAQLTDVNLLFVQASQRFQELFQGLPVACFCYDAQGNIIEWNRAFAAMYGTEFEAISGTPLQKAIWETICFPEDKARVQSLIAAVFNGESITDFEWTTGEKHYLCSTFPLRDADGKIVGGIVAKIDITARKLAEESVRRSEERLHALYDVTSMPKKTFDEKMDALLQMGCAQFGIAYGVLARVADERYEVRSLAAPPGQNLVPGAVLSVRDTFCFDVIKTGGTLAIANAGTTERSHSSCYALFSQNAYLGTPVVAGGQIWGTLVFCDPAPRETDWTSADTEFLCLMAQWISGELERAQAVEATQASEERFRQAISAMQEGMVLTLRDGTVSICNESAARILETSAEQLATRGLIAPTWRVVREDGTIFAAEDRPTKTAFRRGAAERDVVMGVEKENGEQVWLLVNSIPLFHPDEPTPYAVATTFADITQRRRDEQQLQERMSDIQDYSAVLEFQARELEKANAQLEALATLDGLTSLKNHRAFQERLAYEMERAGRYQPPLSLLMLDVDHFKSYNDTYGHPAGDEILKIVAHLLREGTRETDFVARYGGEEFVVILPHTDMSGACSMGERLRKAIAEMSWPQRPVTASFGVSTLRPHCVTGADLVAEADQALYFSKSSGRNRVSHASEISAAVRSRLTAMTAEAA